ncbi:Transcription initiation factor TFIID subunit 4B [Merluccius polli]|uniref:Transcription initiation factor TFIID subunit 4B n=1 Tax=Merluccius polli TaxID=89951 RepID=A0AA47NPB0_MERPO|nr:Transcription initiation factor TFIID subunit 4B [Merluccius polli]
MPNEATGEAAVREAQTKRGDPAGPPSAPQPGPQPGPLTAAAPRAAPAHHSGVCSTGQRSVSVVPQTASSSSSSSVLVVAAKVPTPGSCAAGQPLHLTRPSSAPAAVSVVKTPGPARTVVIAVPRTAVPQPLAPRPPQTTTSTQLPANFQIPPGMVLIRSDSGQLMLVSQQTLAQAQAQQAQKATSVPAPRLPAPMPNREAPKPVVVQPLNTVIAQGAQPRTQAGSKETTGTSEPTFTISQETLENVKKCKNFLVTLIKLASSGTQSPDMAANVKALVRSLLDGSLEPEEFTNKLYIQLKSTPQPYLVPFLKKSLPAVRHLTADPQHFIQQAGQPKPTLAPLSTTAKPSGSNTGLRQTLKNVVLDKYPRGVPLGPAVTGPGTHLRTGSSEGSRTTSRGMVVLSGQQHPGGFSFKRPPVPHQPASTYAFKDTSYKEDDDINDVASMAGVNLREESVRILASGGTMVGSVVQSCHDTPFLASSELHARILHAGEPLGVSEARPEVVTLVSHATQEFLRDLLEKLAMVAEHRRTSLKEDLRHMQVSDVRSQLHFLEQVELLKKRRQDEEERETLLRLARRRSNSEDPQQQQLRQRAKELQQVEEAQLQHREANLTALAAIGPRKRRPLDSTGNVVSVLARSGVTRVKRVTMRDLLLCMEEDRHMRHSLTLYKALMR